MQKYLMLMSPHRYISIWISLSLSPALPTQQELPLHSNFLDRYIFTNKYGKIQMVYEFKFYKCIYDEEESY